MYFEAKHEKNIPSLSCRETWNGRLRLGWIGGESVDILLLLSAEQLRLYNRNQLDETLPNDEAY